VIKESIDKLPRSKLRGIKKIHPKYNNAASSGVLDPNGNKSFLMGYDKIYKYVLLI